MSEKVTSPRLVHPSFETLVQRIIDSIGKDKLATLRKDFHTRLRITLTQPESSELIEDLWDFFYDWCVFEQKLPENVANMDTEGQTLWTHVKGGNERGLYAVQKTNNTGLKLKELYTGKVFAIACRQPSDFIGIEKGDILEGRLVVEAEAQGFSFVRRPSYHPVEVHDYIKRKVKEFRKTKDFTTYQNWLWLLVGMYLKHRIYQHMPIEKIYDDNSRI